MAGTRPCVGFPDDAAQALSRRAEVVFEFMDLAPAVVGFGCARVAFGEELTGGRLQLGDAGDQLGALRSFDLGAEV